MKVTYIYHSSFCIEFDDMILLFDYFKGTLPEFSKDKKVYVFASHKHQDHFSKVIFELFQEYEHVTYLLSNDIKMNEKYMDRHEIPEAARERIQYLAKDQAYEIAEDLKVETLRSTDEGVAFIITTHGKTIYHAGDLNWWTWNGETEEEYVQMTNAFQHEMKKIEKRVFDVAFLPLDPRQEDKFYLGFDYFMRTTETKKAIPMHFWEQPQIMDRLYELNESRDYRDKVVELRLEGQSIIL